MVHGYAPMGFEDWPVVAVAILLGIAIWTRLLRERCRHVDYPPLSNCIYRIVKRLREPFRWRMMGPKLDIASSTAVRMRGKYRVEPGRSSDLTRGRDG